MKKLLMGIGLVLLAVAILLPAPAFAQGEPKWYRGHDHIGNFVYGNGQLKRVVLVPATAAENSRALRVASGVVETGDNKQVFFLIPGEQRIIPPNEVTFPFTTCDVSVEVRAGYEFLWVQTDATADDVERLLEQLGWATGRAVGSGTYW
jgi:hypothetical protein